MSHNVPIQSLIDHIKTAQDVDPWAKEMVEELLKEQETELQKGRYYSDVFDIGYKAGNESIVRCKDCKFGEQWGVLIACGKARGFGLTHDKDWFCADGKKRIE